MKNEEKDKPEKQKTDNKKDGKSEEIKSIPQTPLVTGFETIRIRIKTELMSVQECERLRRITARDSRIIRDYLRIIYHNEDRKFFYKSILKPLIKSDGKVNKSLLDCLTLTTFMKTENKIRSSVPHDLKKRYPHCSHDEFLECRNKATWVYESWKALQRTSNKELSRPQFRNKTPRQLNKGIDWRGTLQVHYDPDNTEAKLLLKLRDTLDSKQCGKRNNPKLKTLEGSPKYCISLFNAETCDLHLLGHSSICDTYRLKDNPNLKYFTGLPTKHTCTIIDARDCDII